MRFLIVALLVALVGCDERLHPAGPLVEVEVVRTWTVDQWGGCKNWTALKNTNTGEVRDTCGHLGMRGDRFKFPWKSR